MTTKERLKELEEALVESYELNVNTMVGLDYSAAYALIREVADEELIPLMEEREKAFVEALEAEGFECVLLKNYDVLGSSRKHRYIERFYHMALPSARMTFDFTLAAGVQSYKRVVFSTYTYTNPHGAIVLAVRDAADRAVGGEEPDPEGSAKFIRELMEAMGEKRDEGAALLKEDGGLGEGIVEALESDGWEVMKREGGHIYFQAEQDPESIIRVGRGEPDPWFWADGVRFDNAQEVREVDIREALGRRKIHVVALSYHDYVKYNEEVGHCSGSWPLGQRANLGDYTGAAAIARFVSDQARNKRIPSYVNAWRSREIAREAAARVRVRAASTADQSAQERQTVTLITDQTTLSDIEWYVEEV